MANALAAGNEYRNDVMLDRARADLERAARLVEAPAELTVLFGALDDALLGGVEEFGCDAIMSRRGREPPREAVLT